ncbi:MAG: GNAT family N-acetyltransferase [bacterium]|nr:GNAT family N-acetyltransferase [bacterium]
MKMSRVKIREYVLADLDAYADWQSDPEVARHITWLPKTRAQSRACLADAIAQQTTVPRIRHFFAVVLADTDETIGNVGLTITGPGTGDCGWFLRRHYWGCGYATDAAQLLIEYAFQALGLERLTASCAVGNSASERVMLKCGFVCVERSETRAKYEIQRTAWQQAQQALTADAAKPPC